MSRLKADLHTHSADDALDGLGYSSEMLIDAAAQSLVDVLAITCHEEFFYSKRLAAYARERGVLLMPGTEALLDGKHVVLLNPDEHQAAARTFDQLRALGRRDAAVLAPHPFYLTATSLRGALVKNIDLFDAIEFCSLHVPGLNPNRRAQRVAEHFGLALVATSDAHRLPYSDSCFTWIDAEPTIPGVIQALRKRRVQVETRPRSASRVALALSRMAWDVAKNPCRHLL